MSENRPSDRQNGSDLGDPLDEHDQPFLVDPQESMDGEVEEELTQIHERLSAHSDHGEVLRHLREQIDTCERIRGEFIEDHLNATRLLVPTLVSVLLTEQNRTYADTASKMQNGPLSQKLQTRATQILNSLTDSKLIDQYADSPHSLSTLVRAFGNTLTNGPTIAARSAAAHALGTLCLREADLVVEFTDPASIVMATTTVSAREVDDQRTRAMVRLITAIALREPKATRRADEANEFGTQLDVLTIHDDRPLHVFLWVLSNTETVRMNIDDNDLSIPNVTSVDDLGRELAEKFNGTALGELVAVHPNCSVEDSVAYFSDKAATSSKQKANRYLRTLGDVLFLTGLPDSSMSINEAKNRFRSLDQYDSGKASQAIGGAVAKLTLEDYRVPPEDLRHELMNGQPPHLFLLAIHTLGPDRAIRQDDIHAAIDGIVQYLNSSPESRELPAATLGEIVAATEYRSQNQIVKHLSARVRRTSGDQHWISSWALGEAVAAIHNDSLSVVSSISQRIEYQFIDDSLTTDLMKKLAQLGEIVTVDESTRYSEPVEALKKQAKSSSESERGDIVISIGVLVTKFPNRETAYVIDEFKDLTRSSPEHVHNIVTVVLGQVVAATQECSRSRDETIVELSNLVRNSSELERTPLRQKIPDSTLRDFLLNDIIEGGQSELDESILEEYPESGLLEQLSNLDIDDDARANARRMAARTLGNIVAFQNENESATETLARQYESLPKGAGQKQLFTCIMFSIANGIGELAEVKPIFISHITEELSINSAPIAKIFGEAILNGHSDMLPGDVTDFNTYLATAESQIVREFIYLVTGRYVAFGSIEENYHDKLIRRVNKLEFPDDLPSAVELATLMHITRDETTNTALKEYSEYIQSTQGTNRLFHNVRFGKYTALRITEEGDPLEVLQNHARAHEDPDDMVFAQMLGELAIRSDLSPASELMCSLIEEAQKSRGDKRFSLTELIGILYAVTDIRTATAENILRYTLVTAFEFPGILDHTRFFADTDDLTVETFVSAILSIKEGADLRITMVPFLRSGPYLAHHFLGLLADTVEADDSTHQFPVLRSALSEVICHSNGTPAMRLHAIRVLAYLDPE